jgi:transcriptional regulator with XRE-family HTH domain
MAKPFKILREKMSPGSRARAADRTKRILLEMSLQELRENLAELTQADVAEILNVTQAHVSKLERRGDMLVSTLFAYVGALGGELEFVARVRGREVRIKNPGDVKRLEELRS